MFAKMIARTAGVIGPGPKEGAAVER
jgi:hypothetical protein